MAYKPYKKGRKSTKRAPLRRKASYYKPKKNLVKTIKQVIHSQVENKVASQYAVNQLITYAGISTTASFINLTPTVSQGVSVQQRVGNCIRVVKARIHGCVNVRPYDATFNPQPSPVMIKMWLCRRKQTNIQQTGLPTLSDFNNFFQSGATSTGFQSNVLDTILRSNSEVWSVFSSKTVTLQNGYYAGATAPTTAIIGQAYKVSAPFSFDFTKHLGLCKYNDNVTYPQNKELFLVFQNVYADGSGSVSALQLAEVHYNIEWEFEDA